MVAQSGTASYYNESYKQENFFRYRTWIYEPFISSLIAFCGLRKGSSVLDVGCGYGFFSSLFYQHDMRVHGIDVSETGIQTAAARYGRRGITFTVADIETAAFAEQFDCVFVRSCSLYNTDIFPSHKGVTPKLLKHLKTGGILIFVYNTHFSSKVSATWRHHSVEDVRSHFSGYRGAKIFLLNKITTYVLRKYSITPLLTRLNTLLCRSTGMGGELVCVLRKPDVLRQ